MSFRKNSVREILSLARRDFKPPSTPRHVINFNYKKLGVKLDPIERTEPSHEFAKFETLLKKGDITVLKILHVKSQDTINDVRFLEEGLIHVIFDVFKRLVLDLKKRKGYSKKKLIIVGIFKNVSFENENNQNFLIHSKVLPLLITELQVQYGRNFDGIETPTEMPSISKLKIVYLIEVLSLLRNLLMHSRFPIGEKKRVMDLLHSFFLIDNQKVVLHLLRIFSKLSFDLKITKESSQVKKEFVPFLFHYLRKYGFFSEEEKYKIATEKKEIKRRKKIMEEQELIKQRIYFILSNFVYQHPNLITSMISDEDVDFLIDDVFENNNKFLIRLISNIAVNKKKNLQICKNERIRVFLEYLLGKDPNNNNQEEEGKKKKKKKTKSILKRKNTLILLKCLTNLSFHLTEKNYFFRNRVTVVKILLEMMDIKNNALIKELLKTLINFTKDEEVKNFLHEETNFVKFLFQLMDRKRKIEEIDSMMLDHEEINDTTVNKKDKIFYLILCIMTNLSASDMMRDKFNVQKLIDMLQNENNEKAPVSRLNSLILKILFNLGLSKPLNNSHLISLSERLKLFQYQENKLILESIMKK